MTIEQRAESDPLVRLLLGLYDLAELDIPPEPEPAGQAGTAFVPLERLRVGTRRP
jgi:hypothetical protein